MLEALTGKNYVKKLSLVNASLNSEVAMSKLSALINNSRYLMDLDISWNGLRPTTFFSFLESIAENRTLQYLNLSWNNLMERADINPTRGGP